MPKGVYNHWKIRRNQSKSAPIPEEVRKKMRIRSIYLGYDTAGDNLLHRIYIAANLEGMSFNAFVIACVESYLAKLFPPETL